MRIGKLHTVATGVGTLAGLGLGLRVRASEEAVRSRAALVCHAKTTTVARYADNDLFGRHTRLGDHTKGVPGLGAVDVGSETVAVSTARVGELVTVVPLPVQVVGHEDKVVQHLGHLINGERLQVPVGTGQGNG